MSKKIYTKHRLDTYPVTGHSKERKIYKIKLEKPTPFTADRKYNTVSALHYFFPSLSEKM